MIRRERVRDFACIAGLIAIAAVFFADILFAGAGFYERDLYGYHYALKHTVVETVRSGSFPYWNRFISGGQPLAANPAFELFYPPQWLIFIGTYATAFQLHILLHVAIALAGMFLFLRRAGLERSAALFGSASFGLGGLLLGTTAMLPTFFVWSWAPLCAYFVLRFLEAANARSYALAAVVCAMPLIVFEPIALGEMWLLLLCGALWRESWTSQKYWRAARGVLLVAAGTLLIAAVVVIPAIGHTRDSVRSRGFSYETAMQFSMPLARPLEFFVPNFFGMLDPEKNAFWGSALFDSRAPYVSSFYCGFGVAIFALAGLLMRMRGSRFVLATAAVAYVLAIGRISPLLNLAFAAGIRFVRYPEKFFIGACVVAIVFAAAAAHRFLRGEGTRAVLTAAWIVAGVNAALATISFFPIFPSLLFSIWHVPVPSMRLAAAAHSAWLAGAFSALSWATVLLFARRERTRPVLFLAAMFLLIDLGRFSSDVAPRMPRSFFEPPPAEAALRGDTGAFSVFHRGRWVVDDPAFLAQSSVMPASWLGRNALLPYAPVLGNHRTVLEPDWDETALLPTHDLLDKLLALGAKGGEWSAPLMTIANAGTVIDYAPPSAAQTDVESSMPVLVRGIPFSQPRYFFATKVVPVSEFDRYVRAHPAPLATAFVNGAARQVANGRVVAVRETPNGAGIDVDAAGPAFLVMTVTRHKYWRVEIDGKPVPVVAANLAFQGIEIPAGRHRVAMRYSNPLIAGSAAVSLVALAAVIAAIMKKPRT